MVKLGDIGDDVKLVQKLLIERGFHLDDDAIFGEKTEQAVRQFQQSIGLVRDGIVGDKTFHYLKYKTPMTKHLKQASIDQAAQTLGVAVAVIMAVNEIESNGTGFLPDGRIKILFERHIMYRRLKDAAYDADTLATKHPKLVNKKPGGYRGGWAEHTRLKSAQAIDSSIALESCSWGQYQIMGFHWQALDFESVERFVEYLKVSEGHQLAVFVQFIQANPEMHKALKTKKWATFAKLYNGPNFKINLYDAKLAQSYQRHQAAIA